MKLRIVPFVVFMLLALAHIPRGPKIQSVIVGLLVASTIAVQIHMYLVYQRGSTEIQEVLAGIQAFPAGATLLPVIPDRSNRVGHTRPLLHVWGYYHLEKGGSGPYLFSVGNIHPVQYRNKPPAPTEGADVNLGTLTGFLPFYDTLLVVNANSSWKGVLQEDFYLIFANETTQLFQRRFGN
jgi:hypothetical protein